ncbi:MAG: hypothetical protein ABSC23_03140 [Bryobacteraceae bacterium]|jgi:hypothetical protein
MTAARRVESPPLIGRSPERLSLSERIAFAGKYVAFEIYTPEATPLRLIEAAGDSAAACVRELKARGLDPARFEIVRIARPY